MGYDDVRAAIGKGLYVRNLRDITRLCYELLNSDSSIKHPSAAYAVADICNNIAWYFDGQPVREETASVIEAHIQPKLQSVIDAAEGDSETLVIALDELVRAFVDAGPFLQSIGK